MEVTVPNFGPAAVRDVPVLLDRRRQARPAVDDRRDPAGQDGQGAVPRLLSPGRPALHQGPAGQRRRRGRQLPLAVVDLPAGVPVLLIDGDPAARDATYLGAALAPGGQVRTGIQPRIEKPPVPQPQAAGRLPGDRPGERRAVGPLGRRGPGAVRARRRRIGLVPRPAVAAAASSTTRFIAAERAFSLAAVRRGRAADRPPAKDAGPGSGRLAPDLPRAGRASGTVSSPR